MAEITFYIIAFYTCLFAYLTVASRQIFHSAVWLSLCLVSIASIYFYLDAQFLGVIQVLVYIGGIITLFIFAIKLTAKIGDVTIRQTNKQVFASLIVSLIIFVLLVKAMMAHSWARGSTDIPVISLQDIGKALLTTYVVPFELISLVLLAAMTGAIVIGKIKK